MIILLFLFTVLISADRHVKRCPGRCMSNITQCNLGGERVAGYCTNNLACCDHSSRETRKKDACYSKIERNYSGNFRSPDYPKYSRGGLICQFEFGLSPNASGIMIDFVDMETEGRGLKDTSGCDSDRLILKGFGDWTPPIYCGKVSNYLAVIDLNSEHTKGMNKLIILAIMSSKQYKWDIKVSQIIHQNAKNPKQSPPPEEHDDDEDRISWSSGNDDKTHHQSIFDTPMVVNGENVPISKIPWQASIRQYYEEDSGQTRCIIEEGFHFCGGSVISDNLILSAGHCVIASRTWQNVSEMRTVLGDSHLCNSKLNSDQQSKLGISKDETLIQKFQVEKVYFHYGFDRVSLINDIIVIKLKEKIKFNENIRPIKLAQHGMTFEEGKAIISGWGRYNLTVSSKPPLNMLQIGRNVFFGNESMCRERMFPRNEFNQDSIFRHKKYTHTLRSEICTLKTEGMKLQSIGKGDSGGPIIQNFKGENGGKEPVLIGVTSSYIKRLVNNSNPHDMEQFTNYFTSVAYFRKWIDIVMSYSE